MKNQNPPLESNKIYIFHPFENRHIVTRVLRRRWKMYVAKFKRNNSDRSWKSTVPEWANKILMSEEWVALNSLSCVEKRLQLYGAVRGKFAGDQRIALNGCLAGHFDEIILLLVVHPWKQPPEILEVRKLGWQKALACWEYSLGELAETDDEFRVILESGSSCYQFENAQELFRFGEDVHEKKQHQWLRIWVAIMCFRDSFKVI